MDCFLEGWGDDDLSLGGLNSAELLVFFTVEFLGPLDGLGGLVDRVGGGPWDGEGFVDVVTVGPFSGWGVFTSEEDCQGYCSDD